MFLIFIVFFFISAVLDVGRESYLYDFICYSIDSVTFNKHIDSFFAVQDKPQHQRQKYISQTTEEVKSRVHSIVLSPVLAEENDKLRNGVGKRDNDVAESDKRIYFSF